MTWQLRRGLIVNSSDSGPSDPFWSSVVFLAPFEGADQDISYTELAKGHVVTGSASNAFISNAQAEYGSTSLESHNTTGSTVTDHADYNLSAANSDQFTIDYSFYQTDTAANYGVFNRLTPGSGNFGFLIRHNAGDIIFFWSSDGTSLQSLTATGGLGSANVYNKYRISKNSAGKIRIFKAGVMLTSATPANSVFFASTGSPIINASGAGQDSWLDNFRITKGVCRDDSDSNYTLATAPFPSH